MANVGGTRPGILTVNIADKAELYSSYMGWLKSGGIFVRTPRRYNLGEEVFVLLGLPETSEKLPVAGKVVWLTPAGAQNGRPTGIGVKFPDTQEGDAARRAVENILVGKLNSDQPTFTM